MTKKTRNMRYIIREVSKGTRIDPGDVELIIKATLEAIKRNVKAGHRIEIRGFGSFYPKHLAPRRARRPINGAGLRNSEVMEIPARTQAAFKPSKKYFSCTT